MIVWPPLSGRQPASSRWVILNTKKRPESRRRIRLDTFVRSRTPRVGGRAHRLAHEARPGGRGEPEIGGQGPGQMGLVADQLGEGVLDELAGPGPVAPGGEEGTRLLEQAGGPFIARLGLAEGAQGVGVGPGQDPARTQLGEHALPDRLGGGAEVRGHDRQPVAGLGLGRVEPGFAGLAVEELDPGG
jgi:hypothetical protein